MLTSAIPHPEPFCAGWRYAASPAERALAEPAHTEFARCGAPAMREISGLGSHGALALRARPRSLATLFSPDPAELADHYPSLAERRADKTVHLVGMALSVAVGTALFASALDQRGPSIAGSIALYSVCAALMLACSALYNLAHPGAARRLLRRLDETAIFMMIAGTAAPYLAMLPSHAWTAQGLEWALAAAGAAGKVFAPQLSNRLWTKLYIAYGALSLLLVGPALARLPTVSLTCLAATVIAYGLGVLVFLNHGLPYRRAVWHLIIVVAAAVDFGALATGLVYG